MPCQKCIGSKTSGAQCARKASCAIGCHKFCWQHIKDIRGGNHQRGTCTEPPELARVGGTHSRNKQRRFAKTYLSRNPTVVGHQPTNTRCVIEAFGYFFGNIREGRPSQTRMNTIHTKMREAFPEEYDQDEGFILWHSFPVVEPIINLKHMLVARLHPDRHTFSQTSHFPNIDDTMSSIHAYKYEDVKYHKAQPVKYTSTALQLRDALNNMTPNRYYAQIFMPRYKTSSGAWVKEEAYAAVIKRRVKEGMWIVYDGVNEESGDAEHFRTQNLTMIDRKRPVFIRVFALLPAPLPRNVDK